MKVKVAIFILLATLAISQAYVVPYVAIPLRAFESLETAEQQYPMYGGYNYGYGRPMVGYGNYGRFTGQPMIGYGGYGGYGRPMYNSYGSYGGYGGYMRPSGGRW